MEPLNLATVEIKAFVPARDFERSKAFYQAIGFTVAWTSDDLAYLHCGESSFLLQKFFVQQHADNFMMHLLVENVDDWHRRITSAGVAEQFGIEVGLPGDRPWAMRDFTVIGPSGVLWRVAQNIPTARVV